MVDAVLPQSCPPAPPGRARLRWRDALSPRALRDGRDRQDPRRERVQRLEDALEVLEGARALVERGWVQGAWYRLRTPSGGEEVVGPFLLRLPADADVAGACLVGAVRQVAKATGKSDAAPLALLWDAIGTEQGMLPSVEPVRAVPREIRAWRIRDLTRWNDRPGRSAAEVVRLLDAASTRAILEAVGGAPAR